MPSEKFASFDPTLKIKKWFETLENNHVFSDYTIFVLKINVNLIKLSLLVKGLHLL